MSGASKMLILLLFLLPACTVKTQIIDQQGQSYIVVSKTDAIVTIDKEKVIVDNRGRPGMIEQVFVWLFASKIKTVK